MDQEFMTVSATKPYLLCVSLVPEPNDKVADTNIITLQLSAEYFTLRNVPENSFSLDEAAEAAELSSLLSLLQTRPGQYGFEGEEVRSIVVATSRKSLVENFSPGLEYRKEHGWRNEAGREMANKELWVRLYQCLREMDKKAVKVEFCYVDKSEDLARSFLSSGYFDDAKFQWAEGEKDGA